MNNEIQLKNQEENKLAERNTQTEMMIARQAQEVQVAMIAAKKLSKNDPSRTSYLLLP